MSSSDQINIQAGHGLDDKSRLPSEVNPQEEEDLIQFESQQSAPPKHDAFDTQSNRLGYSTWRMDKVKQNELSKGARVNKANGFERIECPTPQIQQLTLLDTSPTPTSMPNVEKLHRTPHPLPSKAAMPPTTAIVGGTLHSELGSQAPSRRPSTRESQSPKEYWSEKEPAGRSSTSSDADFDEKQRQPSLEMESGEAKSEIQSIMDQFSEGDEASSTLEQVMSPRLEKAGQFLTGPMQHPPRKSSLQHANAEEFGLSEKGEKEPVHKTNPPVPPKDEKYAPNPSRPTLPAASMSSGSVHVHAPPPPAPDPEPDLPFDFHRFLEQLRHRKADPVAKFLRSFLNEFGKKQWMVHEQVKIISDFLAFITVKMAQCEVWKDVSDSEFDNAKEGMEKLIMNRLYTQTFSPAIPPPQPLPPGRGRRKDMERMLPGRRGQHQEDVERDEILAQKVKIYSWVREEHLDITPVGPSGKKFLALAEQELLKIKGYRAPRDKVICVLNCCKVIIGLLRNSKNADTSADSFIPLMILVVLHANPDHLVSNVQYILRFRNQEKLGGEAGYYLSSLMGAIQFIENLDRTSLTISDEEFEKNVEAAVSAIAERNKLDDQKPRFIEKSERSHPEVTPRHSLDAERSLPRLSTSRDGMRNSQPENPEDNDPVSGLLRTIQKPLSTIGRILSDTGSSPTQSEPPDTASTPKPLPVPRLSPSVYQPPRPSEEDRRSNDLPRSPESSQSNERLRYNAEEAAARQASAEAAEAQRIQRTEHNDVVETLVGMFPNLDKEVIDDVVRMKEGRVGQAVDACLALSS